MPLTKQQLKQIIKEEFANLVNEEEIDEKLLSALKGIGKGLYNKATDFMSGKPKPNASQGVGRAFARYKVPQKQPMAQPEPEIQPGTGMTVRDPAQGMQISDPDAEQPSDYKDAPFGSSYSVNQPKQLGTGQPTDSAPQDVESSGDFQPSGPSQKQLPAPEKIGVVANYGELLQSTTNKSYSLVRDEVVRSLLDSEKFKSLKQSQKQILDNVETVLKDLVLTKRVLLNSTIGPIVKDVKSTNEERDEKPSYQQVGLEDWYINSLIITTKKKYGSRIPQEIVEYVIRTLYEKGRLAISTRLYNKLLHTNDPAIQNPQDLTNLESEPPQPQQESKSYNNFYNNWKKYTKPGVKI